MIQLLTIKTITLYLNFVTEILSPALTMDIEYSLQDVVRCSLCETTVYQCYCDVCHIKLCKPCVSEHISDDSKNHKIIVEIRGSPRNFQMCEEHSENQCTHHCEICNIYTCATCLASENHLGHKQTEINKMYKNKREIIQGDLDELEDIHTRYKNSSPSMNALRGLLKQNCDKLTNALDSLGKEWHTEIDIIISNIKSEITEINYKHLTELQREENEMTSCNSKLKETICFLKSLLDSSNVSLVCKYKSKNAELRRIPPKLNLSIPVFYPEKIDRSSLLKIFGRLSKLPISTDKAIFEKMKSLEHNTFFFGESFV